MSPDEPARGVEEPALAGDVVVKAPLPEPLPLGAEEAEGTPPSLGCTDVIVDPFASETIPLDSPGTAKAGVSVTGIAPVSVVSVAERTAVKVVGIDEAPTGLVGTSGPGSESDDCGRLDDGIVGKLVTIVSSDDSKDSLPAGRVDGEVGMPVSIVSDGTVGDPIPAGNPADKVDVEPLSVASDGGKEITLPVDMSAKEVNVGMPSSAVSPVGDSDPVFAGTPTGELADVPLSIVFCDDVGPLPIGTFSGALVKVS